MPKTTDILIVGGGVIGCAIAYFLRKAGREVTLVEQGEIGAQASSAAAGLLAPLGPISGPGPFANLLLASFAQIPTLLEEIEAVSGIDVEYRQPGSLRIVHHPKHVARLQKRFTAWQPLGLTLAWLSGEEARQREPLLAAETCAAIYAPQEAHARAALVVQAYAQAARKLGATLLSHTEVVGFQHSNGRVTAAILAHQEAIACNQLIVTTGAWSALCGKWLQLRIPVHPERGQMMAIQQPSPPLQHILFGGAAYIVPKGDQVFVGATKEEVGFNIQVTNEGVAWLQQATHTMIPGAARSGIIKTWAGLRPKTPDARPILGPAPGWENVTLAMGHGSVGVILSAITAQTLTEYLLTGTVPELIRPFSLQRFTTQTLLAPEEPEQ